MSKVKVICCTNHCGQCHRHFHSLDAFDRHQQYDNKGWPICLDPLDLLDKYGQERLVPLTTKGECRMYAETKTGVTIWTNAGYEKAAARFRSKDL